MAVREQFPAHTRIAVPPGVGDCYWVLAKLHDFRRKNLIKKVTFCVKKASLVRALDWSMMTPLVEQTVEFDFEPDKELKRYGYSYKMTGVNCGMWPNSIIDRGQHLAQWMPRYALDLDFPINVDPGRRYAYLPIQDKDPDASVITHDFSTADRHHVVYASSEGVNRNWFPGRGPEFWDELLYEIAERTGRLPMLIGAGWDKDFARHITAPCLDMIGETNLPEVAGIIKRARSVTGMISGMTILANHFRTPCTAIYPDRFMPGFLKAWIKPNTPYLPIPQSRVTSPHELARVALSISN